MSAGVAVQAACKWLADGLPTRKHAIPSLPFVNEMNEGMLNNWKVFIRLLTPIESYHYGNKLWPITKAALVSWLLHYDDFVCKYTQDNICVRHFLSMLDRSGFQARRVIIAWSHDVKQAFIDESVACHDSEVWEGQLGVALRNVQQQLPVIEVSSGFIDSFCIYYV